MYTCNIGEIGSLENMKQMCTIFTGNTLFNSSQSLFWSRKVDWTNWRQIEKHGVSTGVGDHFGCPQDAERYLTCF